MKVVITSRGKADSVGFQLIAENDVDKAVLGLMAEQPNWTLSMKEWGSEDRSGMPKAIGFEQRTAPTA